MEKLALVAKTLQKASLVDLVDPGLVDVALLKSLHAPAYVDAFLRGQKPLATSQGFTWTPQLRDGVLAMQAGQLVGAQLAMEHGVAANIGQGFHHALYDYGCAFCTFNGLALIAQEMPHKRIFVLDCDQHGGNGTAEFTERYENLFNYTIYGMRFGCRDYPRSIGRMIDRTEGGFSIYKQALSDGFRHVLDWRTDLLIYQAGVDCHKDDRFGSQWLDTVTLFRRDKMVFDFAHRYGVPILFVMAGGYQELRSLVRLHVNTFIAADDIFYRRPVST